LDGIPTVLSVHIEHCDGSDTLDFTFAIIVHRVFIKGTTDYDQRRTIFSR
jgi:hypothetical protein